MGHQGSSSQDHLESRFVTLKKVEMRLIQINNVSKAMVVKVTQSCPTLAIPWTVARKEPLSIGFSRQEYWNGLPFPSLSHDSVQFSSVQFSHSVMSDSLQPPELQHFRPPCPSPTPGVHSNSRPSVSDAIHPSHPLSSPFPLPPIPPSIRVFSSESTLRMRWPKYWSFSFSIIPSKVH